jgi:oligoribonuclease (3'-5' exoribonuclease)
MNANLTWIDLETDGLLPGKCTILEVGLIVTTPSLTVLEEQSWLVQHPDVEALFEGASARVQQMHLDNGLWAELLAGGGRPVAEVDRLCFEAITRNGGQRGPLCGFNPSFDREFLQAYMPKTANALHYRLFDLRAFAWAGEWWGSYVFPLAAGQAHRALADCRSGIECARGVRAFLYGAKNER